MDELPIGRRVSYWRRRRNMSQQVFADRLGKSKSWVDKVERGIRRLDKFSVVAEIAEVLQVDVQLLLGCDPQRRVGGTPGIDRIEVEEIRAALERYDQLSAFCCAPQQPPSLAELRKAVNHAWQTFQHAKYGALGRTLPGLLRDAQAADAACSADVACSADDDAPIAAQLLAQVYQLASSVLRKVGEHELAWLAADRSVAVAQRAGDPLLAGTASYRVGCALLALGRARAALEVNLSVANRLAPDCAGNSGEPKRLSVYGTLLLQGAMAAAHIGDSATVRDLLDAAAEAADYVGDQNHYWTSFGPTNVQLHRSAAAVELGEGRLAVQTHAAIDQTRLAALTPERRAHHFLDLSRGYAQLGDVTQAGEMLLEGDRLAPAEIRCRPIAHEVLADILRRTPGSPPQPIVELAEQVGVGG